jgi:hypothetical protein
VNRVAKKEKEFPPCVDWNKTHKNFQVFSHADETTPSKIFPTSIYPEKYALRLAMQHRMQHIIETPEYRDQLFPADCVDAALSEKGLPTEGELENKLAALMKEGFNLWSLVYGGKFASYVEGEYWSPEGYAHSAGMIVRNKFREIAIRKEGVREECERLLKEVARVCDAEVPTEFESTVRIGTEKRLGSMESLLDTAADSEKARRCALIMSQAESKMMKAVSTDPPVERQARKYKPDSNNSISKWSSACISRDDGSVISCRHAFFLYEEWCKGSPSIEKSLAYQPFMYYMREIGWERGSTSVFVDARMM